MDQVVKAGIFGFIIAFAIYLLPLEVDLYFLPEFVASIIAIYVFGLKAIKDGLLAAFTIYTFTEGIVGGISLALYFNESINITVDVSVVLSQILIPLTALLAGLIGVQLAKTKPTTVPTPPSPPPIEPV